MLRNARDKVAARWAERTACLPELYSVTIKLGQCLSFSYILPGALLIYQFQLFYRLGRSTLFAVVSHSRQPLGIADSTGL